MKRGKLMVMAGLLALAVGGLVWVSVASASKGRPTYDDPGQAAKEDRDFEVQGEFSGEISVTGGSKKLGVQVIALGYGKFRAVRYEGGLPGDGWGTTNREVKRDDEGDEGKKDEEKEAGSQQAGWQGGVHGKLKAETQRRGPVSYAEGERDKWGDIEFKHQAWVAVLDRGGDTITMSDSKDNELGKLSRVDRKSPTLGQEAPEGAVVLFDGKNVDAWQNGRMTRDGLLMEGTTTKQGFGDFFVHLEFRTPYMPQSRGQARGNSGLYIQRRYEVQILDSFGLTGRDNECGGIYKVASPSVNMCLPPLSWQTYDVYFEGPKFGEDGKKKANARVTVFHNGVMIHDALEVPGPTGGGVKGETAEGGPIYLQNHGNPVRFRNIWVLPKQ